MNTMLSAAGRALLASVSNPDAFAGLPDAHRGLVLRKHHRYTNGLVAPAGSDIYLLLAPVPGIAFFSTSMPAGQIPNSGLSFLGTAYSDYTTMFPAADTVADVVNSFRFVSNRISISNTGNETSWSGALTAFRLPVKVLAKPDASTQVMTYAVTGLNGVISTSAHLYSGNVRDGLLAQARNLDGDYPFSNILEGTGSAVPPFVGPSDWGQLISGQQGFPGFDNAMECICIRLTGASTTVANTLIVQTSAVVEYTANPTSSVYDYQVQSPPHDANAIRRYRDVQERLPVATPIFRRRA